jgi:hypothetical protein
MEEGMGMVRQGPALSDGLGPALGRGLGVERREKETSHAVSHGGHDAPAEARLVPGFPQDMMMAMDAAVAKPETHGMRPGWSAAIQGMMTVVRVLPPERYEEVRRLMREAGG